MKTKQLKVKLKFFDRVLRKSTIDADEKADALYRKANVLTEIAEIEVESNPEINIKEEYNKAIILLNEAIELSENNPLFHVDRAKLYVKKGDINFAAEDIIKTKEIMSGIKRQDSETIYISNVLERLMSLEEVKHHLGGGGFNEIIVNSVVLEQENILQFSLGATPSLDITPASLAESNSKIDYILSRIEELEENVDSNFDMINSISYDVQINKNSLIELNYRLDSIDVSSFASELIIVKNSFENLNKTIAQLKLIEGENVDFVSLDHRVQQLESSKKEMMQQIGQLVHMTDITGIFNEAKILKGINYLKMENEKLYNYFKVLYFELDAYIEVYRNIGTGLIKSNNLDDLNESAFSNIRNVLSIFGNAGWQVVVQTLDNYGVMSGLYSIASDISVIQEEATIESQSKKINRVIDSKLLSGFTVDKNELIKLALILTKIRESQILSNIEEQEKEEINDNILLKIDKFVAKLLISTPIIDRYTKEEEKLAANDALLILGGICSKHQLITAQEDIPLSAFFNEWSIRELEISSQLKGVLEKIAVASSNGEWHPSPIRKHKNIEGRLNEEYIKQKLGDLYSPENSEAAKLLFFATIALNVSMENIECVIKFAMKYPEIVKKAAQYHPEYFVKKDYVIEHGIQVSKVALSSRDLVDEFSFGEYTEEGQVGEYIPYIGDIENINVE